MPTRDQFVFNELSATIAHGLGLEIHKDLPGPQNRPIPIVDTSKRVAIVSELL